MNAMTKDSRDEKLRELLTQCLESASMDLNRYLEYDVKRGLRESSGKGVLTGLTEVSDVSGFKVEEGRKIPFREWFFAVEGGWLNVSVGAHIIKHTLNILFLFRIERANS